MWVSSLDNDQTFILGWIVPLTCFLQQQHFTHNQGQKSIYRLSIIVIDCRCSLENEQLDIVCVYVVVCNSCFSVFMSMVSFFYLVKYRKIIIEMRCSSRKYIEHV